MKRHHDHGNPCKGKHFIVVALLSSRWDMWCAGRQSTGKVTESPTSCSNRKWSVYHPKQSLRMYETSKPTSTVTHFLQQGYIYSKTHLLIVSLPLGAIFSQTTTRAQTTVCWAISRQVVLDCIRKLVEQAKKQDSKQQNSFWPKLLPWFPAVMNYNL